MCSLLPLGLVIDALITTRILVQFIGQVFAVMLLRANRPDMPRPFRMWLYPVPALVALAGWIFLLLTSGWLLIALGLGTLVARHRVLPRVVVALAPMAISTSASASRRRCHEETRDRTRSFCVACCISARPPGGAPAHEQPASQRTQAPSTDGKLNIIAFGAHPDDCDQRAGGTAAKYAALGHRVRFVSVTNGDAGHQTEGGGALAARRRAEAQEAGRRIGIEYVVLDNHDGELVPSVDVREQIIRQIRQWNADLVLAPRPNDYHPDHRYTGVLVQDAAYMVVVPNIAPDTPALRKNPVFMYFQDGFQRPNPFSPDVAVSIDDVIEKKIDMLDAHVSQFYEWLPWVAGNLDSGAEGRRGAQEVAARDARRPADAGGEGGARQVVRRGEGQGHPARRGVRDLRVRHAAGRGADPEAVSVSAEDRITGSCRDRATVQRK